MDFESLDIASLNKKKGPVHRKFMFIYKRLSHDISLEPDQIIVQTLKDDVIALNEAMDLVFNLFDVLNVKLDEEEKPKNDYEELQKWYEDISGNHLNLRANVYSIINKLEAVTPSSDDVDTKREFKADIDKLPEANKKRSKSGIKLDKISIPKFDGDISSFLPFKRDFLYLTDDMDDVDRHIRLKEAITESSIKKRISNFATYTEAWQFLERRFGDEKRQYRVLLNEIDKIGKFTDAQNVIDVKKLEIFLQKLTEFDSRFAALGKSSEFSTEFMLSIIEKKLPENLSVKWQEEIIREQYTHDVYDLIKFLDNQLEFHIVVNANKKTTSDSSKKVNSAVTAVASSSKCAMGCKHEHDTQDCISFLKLTPEERGKKIREAKFCFKCLKRVCNWNKCSSPTCSTCNGRHHILLHKSKLDASAPSYSTTDSAKSKQPTVAGNAGFVSTTSEQIVLPVVPIIARGCSKKFQNVNGLMLIDSGSQVTLVRRTFAEKLGLNCDTVKLDLSLATEARTLIYTETCSFIISSVTSDFEVLLENIPVLNKVCGDIEILDDSYFDRYEHLKGLGLKALCGKIDVLLGVDFPMLHVDFETRSSPSIRDPIAKLTHFGWALFGPIMQNQEANDDKVIFNVSNIMKSDEISLKTFMNLENLGINPPNCSCQGKSEDEKIVELRIKKSITKIGDQFQIELPWKTDPSVLPKNWDMAVKRLISTEKRLDRQPELKLQYAQKIQQNVDDGFVKEISITEYEADPGWLLPHLPVIKESESTPVRVCFDSAAVYRGYSLNSILYKGPNTYGDMFAILLRFRHYNIGLTADISKMFNRILLHPRDQKFHRFLWRVNSTDDIKVFQWLVLTFGDSPCPSLSGLIMQTNALMHQEAYPIAVESILEAFWVDDLAESKPSIIESTNLKDDLTVILANGGFDIRKWRSNYKPLCDNDFDSNECTVLGSIWNIETDLIKLKMNTHSDCPATKRSILSTIASCYDVHGLASVVTIRAKVFLQKLWVCGLNWNDPLNGSLQFEWNMINDQLVQLKQFEFSRCILPHYSTDVELHCYADAGEKALGAVIFIRVNAHCDDQLDVRFVASKTKISPLKAQSIPRLELNACLIGARLASSVISALKIPDTKLNLWTDSSVALTWLRSESKKYKPYVKERVSSIQSLFDSSIWNYIPSNLNSADALTRGLDTCELENWLLGPDCLRMKGKIEKFEENTIINPSEISREYNKSYITASIIVKNPESIVDIDNFSSYRRLLHVLSVVFFMRDKWLHRNLDSISKYYTMVEVYLYKCAQKFLIMDKNLEKLSPFLDDDGVYRAQGRITLLETVDYDCRNPIILPKCRLSYLIVLHYHQITVHGGQQRVTAELRRKYWIIGDTKYARSISSACKFCRWLRARPETQMMSVLPTDRIMPMTPPFYRTYIDYMGPLLVKVSRNVVNKGYAAVFSCLVTRGIHIEFVMDLSTDSFLLAFRRFSALKGSPRKIYSDNGSNFIGACAYIKGLMENFKKDKIVKQFELEFNIEWQFSTPLASHHNGTIERMIRNVRENLFHVVKDRKLKFNEWATVMHEAAQIINSRPLYAASASPLDKPPITPNHFLIGRSGLNTVNGPLQEGSDIYKRYEFCQALVQEFWDRWIRNFLPNLIPRGKWFKPRNSVCVGDLVILLDKNTPRALWNLAVVTKTFPGKDGMVRSVEVKTKYGHYERPISKLCILIPKKALEEGLD